MGKLRVEHKENSFLNGEWKFHAGSVWVKKFTSKRRRTQDKKTIEQETKEI